MKNMILARAGYFSVIAVFLLFLLVLIFWTFSWFLFLLTLFLIFLYRNPLRDRFCMDKKAILSPIDGRVVYIGNAYDENLGECVSLVIKNAFYNVGSIRSCAKAEIQNVKVNHGLFLCSEIKSSSYLNENIRLNLSVLDKEMAMIIYAGSLDRKLKLYDFSKELEACNELSFTHNGKVCLLLPKDTRILAGLGDEIKACSLLGYFS
ncbi:phosphatidylserine decarboxylase [Campylobacter sp. US33a]|uniref:Phosphatidylserine decarboxylase n=1 Tax=Campylobacter sp. CCS1377 TaxID=3158229 RepID=A0AAU7E833_9BACT|nr:phosphatidylserine decarboxylase [Campylobacter sp. US33a]MCW1359729.1 phosphatidylserine decarboxylase [Campylobacter jejuni]TEY04556.1 phosphatidylserine decarboxylase [Campylobacter sp. US33a]